MKKQFDLAVFVGRFQPYHFGHQAVVTRALAEATHVLLLIGSARRPRSVRDPWTAEERADFIRCTLTPEERERVTCLPLMDAVYNDTNWTEVVQASVHATLKLRGLATDEAKVALIGHKKDNSSYYLRLFPQWASIDVASETMLDATTVRKHLFAGEIDEACRLVPSPTAGALRTFAQGSAFKELRDEMAFVDAYKRAWEVAPYAPVFVTVDAVVTQSGHVILVKRGARPGKGQWALPGGFVNQDERLFDACLRELREETKLKVPVPVLAGSLAGSHVFDDPHRSSRGRTITHAFHIALRPEPELPKIKGSDDATHAGWVPIADIEPERMFEDHYFILRHFLGRGAA